MCFEGVGRCFDVGIHVGFEGLQVGATCMVILVKRGFVSMWGLACQCNLRIMIRFSGMVPLSNWWE